MMLGSGKKVHLQTHTQKIINFAAAKKTTERKTNNREDDKERDDGHYLIYHSTFPCLTDVGLGKDFTISST